MPPMEADAAYSRLPVNLEIRTQSQDPENAQCNLKVVQILRWHATYIYMNNQPHLSKERPRSYTKSPTAQDAFQPILASSAVLGWLGNGVCYLISKMQSLTGGWPYLKGQWKHCLFMQMSCSDPNRHVIWGAHTCKHTKVLDVPEIVMDKDLSKAYVRQKNLKSLHAWKMWGEPRCESMAW